MAVVLSCNRGTTQRVPQGRTEVSEGVYKPGEGEIPLDIQSVAPHAKGTTRWLVTHSAQGHTARFYIEFGAPEGRTQGTKAFPNGFAHGTGRFIAESGSDAAMLIAELQRALKAKKVPAITHREKDLRFDYVILGENQSHDTGSGFADKPRGDWMPIKLFLGGPDDDAEVFFSINPVLKKAEFLIKDQDYGDDVIALLIKVL